LGAFAADGAGMHRLAFYLVLLAIPPAAGAALAAAGDLADGRAVLVQAVCCAGALALLVLSSAVRSNVTETASLPPLAASALVGGVLAYGALGLAWLVLAPVPRAGAASPGRRSRRT
jgi:hypothetical protein